jgi:hypothetical protein
MREVEDAGVSWRPELTGPQRTSWPDSYAPKICDG